MRLLVPRLKRALLLDPEVFEEVEHDNTADGQAMLVVLASSVAGGFGNVAAASLLGGTEPAWSSLLFVAAGFLVTWVAWAFLTLAVGTSLFGGHADMGEMQRTLGFAAAPGLLMLLPGIGLMVAVPWSIVAMVIAVRQALDFTTGKALGTVAVSGTALVLVLLPAACFVAGRL